MHNGWSWADLEPADRTKIFEDLLKDCYEREGITTQQDPPLKKEHATNPLLSKYYYIHQPEQATTKEAELQTPEVRVDRGDIQVSKMNLALGDKGPDIKIEPFAECQSSFKVLDSAKTKVAKNMRLSSLSSEEDLKDLKAMHQNPGKDMICVMTLLLPSWKFPVTWTRQRPRPCVRSWQTGRKKEVST